MIANFLFEKNIGIIRKRFPAAADDIVSGADCGFIKTCESKNGEPVPVFTEGGRESAVHSRYEPLKEASRFVSEISDLDRDLFVVFGFGFAYHIDELLKKIPDTAGLIVVEKYAGMIGCAAAARDLSGLLSDERVSILIQPDHDALSDALRGRSSNRTSFITHRGSFQIDPEYYSRALDAAKSSVSGKDVNIATLAKFEKLWSSNIIRNAPNMAVCPGIDIFFDKFKGVTGILCAAGPSLDAAIPVLKKIKSRALIVAVDTAYKILLKNGIEPHFCVAVDPQVINARYIEGCPETSAVLAADPTVHPAIYRMYKGRRVTAGILFDALKWIEQHTGEKGATAHGGSVSTSAYDFLKRLGVARVVMTGQDLAFTGGYAHCRGSYLDDQIHLRSGRFMTPQMFNRFQLSALPRIDVKGIRSQTVHTNQKMIIFAQWFERRMDAALINATPDGAWINNVAHESLDKILFDDPPFNISEKINEIYSSASLIPPAETLGSLAAAAEKITSELGAVIPHISRGAALSGELVSLVKRSAANGQKIAKNLQALDGIDRIIESKKFIKEIIGFTSQRAIHTITEGYQIDIDEAAMSEDEKTALRSKYLYEGLLEGARFNRRLFGKLSRMCAAELK